MQKKEKKKKEEAEILFGSLYERIQLT